MTNTRNRYLAKQLRAALRRSRWDAGTLARRAYVSRSDMARALVGDTGLSLYIYELVMEQFEVDFEVTRWRAASDPPLPGGPIETVVDAARRRLKTRQLTELAGILRPPLGIGPVSVEDMRR